VPVTLFDCGFRGRQDVSERALMGKNASSNSWVGVREILGMIGGMKVFGMIEPESAACCNVVLGELVRGCGTMDAVSALYHDMGFSS
jgi:hypothetical protein